MKKTLSAIFLSLFAAASSAEPLSQEQGDAILKELKEIHQLLVERQAPARPPEDERLTVDVAGLPAEGKKDAPWTLVMFTDYQCPFCRRFELQTLPEIRRQYVDTGKVRFVVRDFPLSIHPNAEKAAEASHCAQEQGKYWQMRDALVAHYDKLEENLLPGYAKDVGLDEKKFSACLQSGRYTKQVAESVADAERLGISGTPTFVVGTLKAGKVEGVKLVGAMPFPMFDQKLREAMAGAK